MLAVKIISDENIIYNSENIRVKIYEYGSIYTKVGLSDGTVGKTYLKEYDWYNKEIGIQVAYKKAKNKQAIKQIKKLQKEVKQRIKELKEISSTK